MRNPCSVLIWDRKRTAAEGKVIIRPCGAPGTHTISMRRDLMFAVCQRHNGRLRRAGIRMEDS